MRQTGADRRMWAAVIAALAAMALCFALRGTAAEALPPLPWAPPEGAQIQGEGLVDINTAGLEELMTLNGIGETRAKAIIEYRSEKGAFTKAEDIMQIPGIKEGIYRKIQDQIIV